MADHLTMIKRTFVISVLLLLVTFGLTQAGNLVVTSTPSGARVTLSGESTIVGVTPIKFYQTLVGEFYLQVEKPGYESYGEHLFLSPTQTLERSIDLKRKTRFKAALRSVLIPGWGQRYSEHKSRGVTYFIMALGSSAAFLIAENRFQNKKDIFWEAKNNYNSSSTLEEQDYYYPRLVEAQANAYDAESIRRFTIGAVVASWGLSVLDALIFGPKTESDLPSKQFSIGPSGSFDELGFSVAVRF